MNGLLVEVRRTTGAIARRDPAAAREATEAHILNSQAAAALKLTGGLADGVTPYG